jgi:hypothetical protein
MSEKRLNFVPNDGYTEPGYLAAIPGKSVEMRFTFRPLLSEEKRKLLETVEKLKPVQEVVRIAEVLAENIKSWDVVDAKGDAVPVNTTTMRRMKPSIFWTLWKIVAGDEPSDIDPQWTDAEKERVSGDQADAVEMPAPYGESREATDEKNSVGA